MELLLGAILGAIASLVLSLIFIPIFQDRVTDFLVERFSWFSSMRKKTSLTGSWTQEWQVDGRERIHHPDPRLELKQLGNSLVGSFKYSGREYRLRAKIDNGIYVSGTWFDLQEGPTYHGTFQARIQIDGNVVAGKWIGFSRARRAGSSPPKENAASDRTRREPQGDDFDHGGLEPALRC